jgi:hypothetical protein
MGPIFDRSKEHLVPADAAVIHLRRILLTAARDAAAGKSPPKLPSVKKVTGIADTDLAPGQAWQSLVPDHGHRRENAELAEYAE